MSAHASSIASCNSRTPEGRSDVTDPIHDTPVLSLGSSGPSGDVPPPSQVMLVSLNHPALKPFNLDTGTLSIGRDPSADIFLDSPDVSRLHAMIRATGDRVELIDARSSNGTFLNGQKIDRAVIQYGDIVRVGDEELKVVQRPSFELELAAGSGDSGMQSIQATVDEAMRLLAEERRQLAILYTMAIRFLERGPLENPIDLFFSMLDRVVAFDAAFVSIGPFDRSRVFHHPAGLRLKADEVAQLIQGHLAKEAGRGENRGAKAYDGPEDAITLPTYRARSRVLIPLLGDGHLGLLAGVPNAYSPQLDFLIQLGRIFSAALASHANETTT
jgi:pSer/pThr/pTyr-binding forkhead associated (FHA) protein